MPAIMYQPALNPFVQSRSTPKHLRAYVTADSGAQAQHTHHISRLASAQHTSGEPIHLIGCGESSCKHHGSGDSEYQFILTGHGKRGRNQKHHKRAQDNPLVVMIHQVTEKKVQEDCTNVARADHQGCSNGIHFEDCCCGGGNKKRHTDRKPSRPFPPKQQEPRQPGCGMRSVRRPGNCQQRASGACPRSPDRWR